MTRVLRHGRFRPRPIPTPAQRGSGRSRRAAMLPESVGVVKRYRDREATCEQEIGHAGWAAPRPAPLWRRHIGVYRHGSGSRAQAQGYCTRVILVRERLTIAPLITRNSLTILLARSLKRSGFGALSSMSNPIVRGSLSMTRSPGPPSYPTLSATKATVVIRPEAQLGGDVERDRAARVRRPRFVPSQHWSEPVRAASIDALAGTLVRDLRTQAT